MSTTCTVTATITDPSSTSLLGNAFVRFRLRNFTGFVPIVSGSNLICEDQIDAYPNPAGAISQVLTCNTAISPANTFYTCEFFNQGRIVSSANYYFNANTSLNTASNINPAPAPAGPSSIIFENNGVLNSSQTLLNLEAGNNITLTDEGGGTVQIAASGSSFSGNGAYFYGPGITDLSSLNATNATNGGVMNTPSGQVVVYLFELLSEFTVSKASIIALGNQINVHGYFGIYSLTGNKLVDGGQFNNLTAGPVQTNTFTAVTLPPGLYWHAHATNSTNAGQYVGIPVNANMYALLTENATRAAYAANALSGAALPTTLGALTPFVPTASNGDCVFCPLYE